MAEDVEDWQLARAESHTSTGLKSAEMEALEHLPDSDVKDALQQLPGGLPARGLPRRRRGFPVQGDRRDHGHADRHRDVAAAPRPAPAARACSRTTSASRGLIRRRARPPKGERVMSCGRPSRHRTARRSSSGSSSSSTTSSPNADCAEIQHAPRRVRPVPAEVRPGAHGEGAGGALLLRARPRERCASGCCCGSGRCRSRSPRPASLDTDYAPEALVAYGPGSLRRAREVRMNAGQALGRLPWLALFFLRARRLRPVLPMVSSSTWAPGRCGSGRPPLSQERRGFGQSAGPAGGQVPGPR